MHTAAYESQNALPFRGLGEGREGSETHSVFCESGVVETSVSVEDARLVEVERVETMVEEWPRPRLAFKY
jgi:hypothetical protein